MKTVKSKLSLFLAVLMACLVMVPAQAAGPLDPAKTTDLTIHYQYNGSPIAGASFALYKVADRTDYSVFQPLEAFKRPYLEKIDGVAITTELWQGLANTLKSYVADQTNGISANAVATTGEEGLLTFSGLENGLYLVVGQDFRPSSRDTYTSSPFLIALPALDSESNVWQYAVTANPKSDYTHRSKPSNPPKDPPEDPETVSRKVLKIWEDEGSENMRPASIEVRLLRDGEVYDTVNLTAEGNWRWTWDNLSADHDWQVEEYVMDDALIDAYLPLTDWEGITATVTNYAMTEFEDEDPPLDEGPPIDNPPDDDVIIEIPDEPTPLDASVAPPTPATVTTNERLPQTGLLWWPVPVLLSAGLLCVIIGVVRRRGDESD